MEGTVDDVELDDWKGAEDILDVGRDTYLSDYSFLEVEIKTYDRSKFRDQVELGFEFELGFGAIRLRLLTTLGSRLELRFLLL